MTQAQIKNMTAGQILDKLEYIENSIKISGKSATESQKKTIKSLEKQLYVLMPDD